MIKTFNQFINEEKSIGSEAIRNKWYSDIDKSIFYKIVNIDPTSVRKKGFSKPGKYCKWLFIQYKKGNLTNELLDNKEYIDKLSKYLFIFSTNFYKRKVVTKFYLSGETITNNSGLNILNFKTLGDFVKKLDSYYDEWKELSGDGNNYDLIYEDDNLIILSPLDFITCKKYSIDTQWCSQTFTGFKMWYNVSILFRFIFKNGNKARLTWKKDDLFSWSWAPRKYPEYNSVYVSTLEVDPFEFDKFDKLSDYRTFENFEDMTNIWKKISSEGIEVCRKYYNEHK